VLPRHVYRQLGIGWSESLRRVWLPSLGGALPAVLLLVAWKLTMPPRSWPELLLVVAAAAATTFLAAWKFGLGASERVRFWSLAKQGWSKVFA